MTEFRPNFAGFDALARGPEVRGILEAKAEEAKAVAEGIAETFRSDRNHVHYADSFTVETGTETGGGKTRVYADLRNTAGHAAAVEWGYKGRSADDTSSAHRVLGRALDGVSGA